MGTHDQAGDFTGYLAESPEERERRHATMERRYAHLRDRPRPRVADPTNGRGGRR